MKKFQLIQVNRENVLRIQKGSVVVSDQYGEGTVIVPPRYLNGRLLTVVQFEDKAKDVIAFYLKIKTEVIEVIDDLKDLANDGFSIFKSAKSIWGKVKRFFKGFFRKRN